MFKQKFNRFKFRTLHVIKRLKPRPRNLKKLSAKLVSFINSWWQVLLIVAAAIVFLYYPIGGWLTNDINVNTEYEINNKHQEQSAAVAMNAFLINREVNEKMWTPNLPFFFPSYFLDNMPSFQLGLMSAVSNTTSGFAGRMEKTIGENKELHLKEAAKLLRYPGTIWMFSPENALVPAPSANAQYKRARKHLLKFNQELLEGSAVFYRNPTDLSYFLRRIGSDLSKNSRRLETHIREESSSFIDNKCDNIFYTAKGKTYGYYLILRALGSDYKEVLVNENAYSSWTQLLKTLEDAALFSPFIIRNGEIDASFAPNHLQTMAYYELKAAALCKKLIEELSVKNSGSSHAN